jgi:hypothetical protein
MNIAPNGHSRSSSSSAGVTSDRYAQEIFDAVRASRFRPKFVDGQAVAVAGVTYREVFWTGE